MIHSASGILRSSTRLRTVVTVSSPPSFRMACRYWSSDDFRQARSQVAPSAGITSAKAAVRMQDKRIRLFLSILANVVSGVSLLANEFHECGVRHELMVHAHGEWLRVGLGIFDRDIDLHQPELHAAPPLCH